MNDLERIKQVEEEVVAAIEDAREKASSAVIESKSDGGRTIQMAVDKVKQEIASEIVKVEADTQKEADRIVAEGEKKVMAIQESASGRRDDAIKLVMNKLRGD